MTSDAGPVIYLDMTDLIQWVRKNAKVTGIQRVHMSYAQYATMDAGVKFVMFHGRRCEKVDLVSNDLVRCMSRALSGGTVNPRTIHALCPNARLGVWKDYRDKYLGRPGMFRLVSLLSDAASWSRQLLWERSAPRPDFRPGDVLLSVGRGWSVGGYLDGIRKIKQQHGVVAQVLLHDVLPVEHELRQQQNMRFTRYIEGCFEVFDRFLTSSDFNVGQITAYMRQFTGRTKPIDKIRFGRNIDLGGPHEQALPADLRPDGYILCVGRIDASKNQARLLEAWLDLVHEGKSLGKKLVLVGTLNRRYRDLAAQMARYSPDAGDYVLLENVSDEQLSRLYRECRFTVFPSTAEGYGLPAAESLGYGKFCLASNATSIPEVAGPQADYFDPRDVAAMRSKIGYYLAHTEVLRAKEAAIRALPGYSWREATADLLATVRGHGHGGEAALGEVA